MTGIIESGNVSPTNWTSAGHRLNLSFKVLVPMIRHHHEWYDGTGYPDALKGDEIPLGARIISVSDAYISMTTQYSYREAMSQEEALVELRQCSGTQFEPEMVEALCRLMNEDNRQGGSCALDKFIKM